MSAILLEKVDIKKQSSAAVMKSSFLPEHFKKQTEYQRLTDWSSATREDGLNSVLPEKQSSVQALQKMWQFSVLLEEQSSVQELKRMGRLQFC